jgi:SOS-response transcriptional repressor LexA
MNKTKRKVTSNLLQFPSGTRAPQLRPAHEEEEGERINLNTLLCPRGQDVFVLDVSGSDEENGCREGDKLIVNRALMPSLRDLLIVEDRGDFYTSIYKDINGRSVYGVVTHVLRAFRGWNE